MKLTIYCAATLLAAVGMTLLIQEANGQQPQQESDRISISVMVKDLATGKPIPGSKVSFLKSGELAPNLVLPLDGSSELEVAVLPGDWEIFSTADGYDSLWGAEVNVRTNTHPKMSGDNGTLTGPVPTSSYKLSTNAKSNVALKAVRGMSYDVEFSMTKAIPIQAEFVVDAELAAPYVSLWLAGDADPTLLLNLAKTKDNKVVLPAGQWHGASALYPGKSIIGSASYGTSVTGTNLNNFLKFDHSAKLSFSKQTDSQPLPPSDPAAVNVQVWTVTETGERKEQPGAIVTAWQTGDPASLKCWSTTNQEISDQISAGAWQVSALLIDAPAKPRTTMVSDDPACLYQTIWMPENGSGQVHLSVRKDRTYSVDFEFPEPSPMPTPKVELQPKLAKQSPSPPPSKNSVGSNMPEGVSTDPVPIFAIVSVQNTAKRIPDAQPKVDFFLAGADGKPLPGKVMPVSEEDLDFLGEGADGVGDDDPSNWNWYWVESEGPLAPGSYYARATLVGVDPVSSGYEAVETGKTNLFVLSLHPRDALGNLRGTVAEKINDNAKQPLVAWDVIATSQTSTETRKTTTDRSGRYELKLSDGSWWVVCQPTENSTAESIDTAKLGAAKPVSVSITPQQDFTHDITIAQVTETVGPIVSQMAIIGVEGMIGDKLPTVRFGRSSGQAIDGTARSLSEDELLDYGIEPEKDWSWFTAEPSSPLVSGLYRAKATLSDLPNYTEQSSSQQSVSPDQSTYFQVIVPIQETPGSIQGRVLIAGTDPPELVPGATVTLTKLGSGNPPPPMQSADGQFSFKELAPGSWWVSASANDFDSTGAKTVAVKVNETATIDLYVEKRVVPDTKLIALIGMEAGETVAPNVFYSNEDDPSQKRSLNVEAIDLEAARKMGGGAIDPKFSYFIGKPSKPLPAASYRVHANSSNYSNFDSPAKKVMPGFETVVQAWLFRDQGPRLLATLHGHVLGHDPSGNIIEYVAGAKIKFIDASGFTVTEQTTDQNGYYLAEDLPSGRLEFEVIADSYMQERVGRVLDIRPSVTPYIFDFSVIKGEAPTNPKTQLIVGVWTKNEFGEDVRVDDALVTITPTVDATQKRTATTLPETDCEFSVLPGYAYAVTATRSGFLPKSEQEIDTIFVNENGDNQLKIYLQRAVDVRVLLTVLGGSGQSGQPTVYVKPTLGGAPLATVLTPVATKGLRNPLEQQPAKTYWANVQTSLPAGEYFAEADLSGYDSAQGDAKWLWGSDNTLSVTLTPPKDPSKKSYKLAGVVRRRGSDRTMSPFPGASITFENSARNRTRYAFADVDGKYQIELDPDTWHANPVAPSFDASNSKVGYKPVPKQTTIVAGQQPGNLDLVLIQDAKPLTPAALANATAIIEVIGNSKRESNAIPVVEFTSRNIFTPAVRPIASNQYSRLEIPANTTSDWFISIGDGLQPGPVSVRATLGSLVDSTDPRTIRAGQPHTFWLQLGADEPAAQPGKLFVKVIEAGQQPTKYLDGAWINFNRNDVETNASTLGGAFGPGNIPAGTFAISAGAPGYTTSEIQWQSVAPGKTLEMTIPLTPLAVTPSYTVTGSIRVASVTGCGSKDAPTAMFVSETHGEVKATVSLQSDDGRNRNYNVTPAQPLVGGTWLLRADLDRLSAASQPKTIIASQPTTFMAQLDVPSPKIPLLVSVIDSDSKKPIPGASLQLKYPKNALHSVLSLKPSTQEFVEPGDYVLQASAPGYIASPWKTFQLGCEGEPKGRIALKRAPDIGKPTGDLIALVQVVCAEKPIIKVEAPRYLYNSRSGVTLVAFMADGTTLDAAPKVSFLEISDNGTTRAKHEAELVELTPTEVLEATGIAVGDCDKWYRAEMKGLRIGKYKAEASLDDYATATSQPESMTSSTPGRFRLQLSKEGDSSGPGTLTVVVHSADEKIGPLANATVNVKADNEVLQRRETNEKGTANFNVKAGLWSVSVQAGSHANYSHAESVKVPSGENKTIHVYLEQEMLPGPPPATVKVFVYAENATSDAKVPSLEVMRESVGMKSPVVIGKLEELPASEYTDEYPASKWKIYHAEGTTPGLGDVAATAQLESYTSLQSNRKSVQTGETTVLDVFLAPIRPNVDLIVKRSDTKEPLSSISLRIWNPTLGESFSTTTARTTDSEGRVSDVQLPMMGSYSIAVATGSDQFTPFTSKDFEIKQKGSPIIVWLDPKSMDSGPRTPPKPNNPQIASGGTVTPLEPPVAKLLCEFLEQRWQAPETAKALYREASQADPKKQILPFAISLVEAKQENYKLVNALLGQVQQNDNFIWDRAAEARIRLGMLENDYPTVKQKISEFAGIYAKRPVSGASLETVRVMGLAIGAMNSLEGSQGNGQFQNSILAQLSSEYKTAFNRGLDEAPKKPDSMVASSPGDGGDNSEMVQSNPNQKRIDELTAERKLKVAQRDQFERGSVQYQKTLGEIIALSNEIRNLESASTSTKTTTTTQTQGGQGAQSSFAAFAKLPLETWRMELIDQYSPCSPPSDVPKTSSVSPTLRGVVRNAENGLPLAGVEVAVLPPQSSEIAYRLTSDQNGLIEFAAKEGNGMYKVRFSSEKIETGQFAFFLMVEGGREKEFKVRPTSSPGPAISPPDTTQPPEGSGTHTPNAFAATLRISVKDAQNRQPVPGVQVALPDLDYRATTDRTGILNLPSLRAPGSYDVRISGKNLAKEQQDSVTIKAGVNEKEVIVHLRWKAPTVTGTVSLTTDVDQNYTVNVPYTEVVEQMVTCQIPDPSKGPIKWVDVVQCRSVDGNVDTYYVGTKSGRGVIVTPNFSGQSSQHQGDAEFVQVIDHPEHGRDAIALQLGNQNKFYTVEDTKVVVKDGLSDAAIFYRRPALTEEGEPWSSFESKVKPKHFLRHSGFELFVHAPDIEPIESYRGDATFFPTKTGAPGTEYSVQQQTMMVPVTTIQQQTRTREFPAGQPIGGANVTLKPLSGGANRSVETSERGFEVADLPPGKYRLTASYPKFKDATKTIVVGSNLPLINIGQIKLEPLESPTPPPGLSVFGKAVLGTASITERQVPGITVEIEPLGGLVIPSSVKTKLQTNTDGFEFRDLPPGDYRLTASHPDWRNATQTAKVYRDGESNQMRPFLLQLESLETAPMPANQPETPPSISKTAEEYAMEGAIIRGRDGDFNGALEKLRQAILIDPRLPEAHIQMGITLREMGEPRQALESLHRAEKLDPGNLGLWSNYFHVYDDLGDDEGAKRAEKILKLLKLESYSGLVPSLIYPAPGAVVPNGPPLVERFEWTAVKNASSYDYLYYTTGGGKHYITGIMGTEFNRKSDSTAGSDSIFIWKVRARVSGERMPWSEERRFTHARRETVEVTFVNESSEKLVVMGSGHVLYRIAPRDKFTLTASAGLSREFRIGEKMVGKAYVASTPRQQQFKVTGSYKTTPSIIYPLYIQSDAPHLGWLFNWTEIKDASEYALLVSHPDESVPRIRQAGIHETSYRYTSKDEFVGKDRLQGWECKVRAKVNGSWMPWSDVKQFEVSPEIGTVGNNYGDNSLEEWEHSE